MKRCPRCERRKPLSDFHRNAARRDGVHTYCKACNAEITGAKAGDPRHQEARRAQSRRRREKLVADLGGECACCGEDRYEFLQIDHINDDGAEHRRRLGRPNLATSDIRAHGLEHFRILCANCNFARGAYGECPHTRVLATN